MKDLKEEYLRLRCGHVSSQLADVVMIKKTRRNIARLNTVLTEIHTQQSLVEGKNEQTEVAEWNCCK